MLDTMMGACWEDVVISGTCDTQSLREEKSTTVYMLTVKNLPRRALRRKGGRGEWPHLQSCLPRSPESPAIPRSEM